MPVREFPHQFKIADFERESQNLLEQYQAGDQEAQMMFAEFAGQSEATLDSARRAIARSYGEDSFDRIELSLRMVDALTRNDLATVRKLIEQRPSLIHENARCQESNWGKPMSFVANLGHNEMIRMLAEMGANDFQHAFGRACLQGRLSTAELLVDLGARIERGVVMGPCETLNADGLGLLIELGAELCDEEGDEQAPLGMLLQTYSRNPRGKHACLDLIATHSANISIPDTPIAAFHRGRIDLLQKHFDRDSELPQHRFPLREIYPVQMGCHTDVTCGLHGTMLDGTTLLHMSVDFDELELAAWLLANGADANAKASVNASGFGGHTPLFNAVVSQAALCGRQKDGKMIELLMEHGADSTARASVQKQLRFHSDETMHNYRDVTPAEYARQFHAPEFVNWSVVELIG